ncbi:uncharacterized protein N7503_001971 [Penicillium pulvis]|uniref:uncharacterized protein n=1 Tax=Penicillium pulvis TaxID=1562058 RepID=UPI0025482400|nr:uncharacterized protein N7503_001971 [Penicillium pulvis]KAJ5809753.1 hypothetical protein N7503_001971 [Penicillium pulvis]
MSTFTNPGQPPAGAYPTATTDSHLYCWGCTLRDDGTHSPYCHRQVVRAEKARRKEEAQKRRLDVCTQIGKMLNGLIIYAIYAPDVDDENRVETLEFCKQKNDMLIECLIKAGLVPSINVGTVIL